MFSFFFFFTISATTDIYTLSLHDALPIWPNDDPIGNSSPRFDEYDESMSQPRPRTARISGGVDGIVMRATVAGARIRRSEEHTSELQSRRDLVCRLLLEKKKKKK